MDKYGFDYLFNGSSWQLKAVGQRLPKVEAPVHHVGTTWIIFGAALGIFLGAAMALVACLLVYAEYA